MNTKDIKTLVDNFVLEDLTLPVKQMTLGSWRSQIVDKHENILMDKSMAESYFESLSIIDSALETLKV